MARLVGGLGTTSASRCCGCLAAVLAALGVGMLAGTARATSDEGSTAVLLAVAGGSDRWAVVASVDDTWWDDQPAEGERSEVYLVDLESDRFSRQYLEVLAGDAEGEYPERRDLLHRYLSRLPNELEAEIRGSLALAEHLLCLDAEEVTPRFLTYVLPDGQRVSVELRRLWTVPSMTAYDRLGFDKLCEPRDGDPGPCSTCGQVDRWVNGEKFTSWACEPVEGQWVVDGRSATCRCDGEAVMYELAVAFGDTVAHGSKVLVQPFRLNQAQKNGYLGEVATDLVIGFMGGSVQLVVTPRGRLIAVGSADHEPQANGTFIPVFASHVGTYSPVFRGP